MSNGLGRWGIGSRIRQTGIAQMAWLLLGLLLVMPAAARVSSDTPLKPAETHEKTTAIITELLETYHYSKPKLNDRISSDMLNRYLEALDPNRHFFLTRDIQNFEVFRYRLDDALRDANVKVAFDIYEVFRKRVKERIHKAIALLEQDHDFTVDEEYQIDYKDAPWPLDEKAADELWRKRVKNDILNLRLSNKQPDEIRDTLSKRYERILRRADQQEANDVYQLFVNAFTNAIDPHSSYFSPHSSENFKINMSLSLEGIGAALGTKNEYTVVQRVISGGPADISGQLHARDRIIGVAQDEAEMVDVIGWRLQDVVELIRGPKGSVVRLLLLPYSAGDDSTQREITLVRDKIKLENQASKSSIIDDFDDISGLRIGVIDVPTFYLDFDARGRGDADYRSTTRDVRRLLEQLKKDNVDGVVIDLRGNGGGSLSEATELTGLFIKSGPVVQVKDTRGDIDINRDPDPELVYDGPLAVLVDRFSASASEIFAGAIQDYHRGIVIGEPTFGKGTVQTLIDLNRFARNKQPDLGQVKITIAQFFRVSGSSTQHRGVRPDIVYPTVLDISEHGERSLDNALPWAKVRSAHFEEVKADWFNLEVLRNQHKSRIARDPGFDFLVSNAEVMKQTQEKKTVSLVEAKRRIERDRIRQDSLERENIFRQSRGLPLLTLEDKDKDREEINFVDDDEEDEDPVRQIQLREAAHILADHVVHQRGRFAVTQ